MIVISKTRGKYSEDQFNFIFLLPLGISDLFAWMNPLMWNKAFCGDGFIWTMYVLRLSGISQLSGANRTETSNILKAHLTDVSSLSSCYILPLLTQSICMLIRCREFYCWAGPCNENHKLRKYSTFKTCSTFSNVKWTETNSTVISVPLSFTLFHQFWRQRTRTRVSKIYGQGPEPFDSHLFVTS